VVERATFLGLLKFWWILIFWPYCCCNTFASASLWLMAKANSNSSCSFALKIK
jgi:hypothetical protein